MAFINEKSPSTSSMGDLKEKHTNTLENIKQLQETEKYLFESLPNMKNKGEDAVRQTVSQINNISTIRKNLFEQLKKVYANQLKPADDNDMTALLQVGEDNLNDTKALLKKDNSKVYNTLRMIQIGNYEFERYNAHKVLMQILAFTIAIIYTIHWLSKQIWLPIPKQIFQITMLFVFIVSGILIGRKIYDLSQRDNQNYLKYDYSYMGDVPKDSDYSERDGVWGKNKSALMKIYRGATGYAQDAVCPV